MKLADVKDKMFILVDQQAEDDVAQPNKTQRKNPTIAQPKANRINSKFKDVKNLYKSKDIFEIKKELLKET